MQKTNNCSDCGFRSFAIDALSKEEIDLHRKNCTGVNFRTGETVFRQGTLNSHIVYIKSGLVKIHINNDDREQIVKIVKAPRYLGISNILGDKVFNFSATALEPTNSCFIDVDIFKELIYRNGKFAYHLLTTISHDELSHVRRFSSQNSKHIAGRVAEALLFFANDIYASNSFSLPITRSELAAYVNATRESATRILLDLKRDNVIELDGKSVKILKKDFLTDIAQKG